MTMTYLALTIGPLYKTLSSAKSTKGIWGASYLFSYLMKQIIEKFVEKANEPPAFLMPYIEYEASGRIKWDQSTAPRVGLIPDRFIAESKDGDFDNLQSAIDEVLVNFSKRTAGSLINHFTNIRERGISDRKADYQKSGKDLLEAYILDYLKSYFQAYSIEMEFEQGNPILDIQKTLDYLELESKIVQKEEYPFIRDLLENCYYNFMVYDEFGNDIDFPSTIEIAAQQFKFESSSDFVEQVNEILSKTDDAKSQERFIKSLKNRSLFRETEFKQHHKYITVVQADGDNLGYFIKTIYETYPDVKKANEVFRSFSYNLLTFDRCVVSLVEAFGGTNIYAGGDDLLFFAPTMVTNNLTDFNFNNILSNNRNEGLINAINRIFYGQPNGKTVFWLIDKIDQIFDFFITKNSLFTDVLSRATSEGKIPSMSYGVALSYYKFPLNEALENSNSLLFDLAKRTSKNAVSYSVLKHSGQYFGTTFLKDSNSYQRFSTLLSDQMNDDVFLTSVMHKLDDQHVLIDNIAAFMPEEPQPEQSVDRLSQFFKNNFNEMVHKETSKAHFLTKVRNLVQAVFTEPPSNGDSGYSADQKMEKIYASLRFIHFIKASDKDDK